MPPWLGPCSSGQAAFWSRRQLGPGWGWEGKEGEIRGGRPSRWSLPPGRVFFDSCDGFFTNYNWREEHLERMLGQAGQRRVDVYVGVDVFARGKVVGGQFDTYKVGGGPRGWGRGCGLQAFHGLVFSGTFRSRLPSREGRGNILPGETWVTHPGPGCAPKPQPAAALQSGGALSTGVRGQKHLFRRARPL